MTHDATGPPQVQDQVSIDFRDDDAYFDRLIDLLLVLYGIRFDHPGAVELRRVLRGESQARLAR
ncbi:MAG: hypothetical protein ACR2HV_09460 [Acidimicrobiales bacterium]